MEEFSDIFTGEFLEGVQSVSHRAGWIEEKILMGFRQV
jgi:hypothetical protein